MSSFKILVGQSGTVKDLETDYGFYVEKVIGMGMPPHENRFSRHAHTDGAAYDGTYIPERVITIVGTFRAASRATVHTNRKALIAAINRDAVQLAPTVGPSLTAPATMYRGEFIFRYVNGANTRDIRVRYDGGLEVEDLSWSGSEKAAIRLIALDPIFRSASYTSDNITTSTALSSVNNFWFVDQYGTYQEEPATGAAGGHVMCMAVDQTNGVIYVGGTFTSMGGVSNTQYIAKYTISTNTWSAVASGLSGGTGVYALLLRGNSLWVGGRFNAPSGGSANISRYNISANTWSALGQGTAGTDPTVYALAFMPGWALYVGGAFDNTLDAGGGAVPNSARISGFGSAWGSPFGSASGTTDGVVYSIVIDRRGLLIVGGSFKQMRGYTVNGFCYYARTVIPGFPFDSIETTGAACGSNANSYITAMTEAPDGSIIVAGTFTSINGAANTKRIARWVAGANATTSFQSVGRGLGDGTLSTSALVRWVGYHPVNGELWAATSGLTLNPTSVTSPIARWRNGHWLPVPFTLSENVVRTVGFYKQQSVYGLGMTAMIFFGASFTSASGTVTAMKASNYGWAGGQTARAWPVLAIKRTGGTSLQFRGMYNIGTGAEIHCIYDLDDGEELTINLEPGQKTVTSNFDGNVIHKVMPGSDIAQWWIEPEVNLLGFLAVGVGSPTITCTMKHRASYWSCD